MTDSKRKGIFMFLLIASFALPALAQAHGQVPASARPQAAQQQDKASQPVVNINTASLTQIMFLPGVGPSKAQAIIAYRDKHRFVRKSQLLRVHGIGPKSLRRLRKMIAIKGPTTMTQKAHASR